MFINNELFKVSPKDYPPKGSFDYVSFWKEQRRRCIEGYSVGGKYMTPELYWYINFCKIDAPFKANGTVYRKLDSPALRDIEWELFNHLYQAEKQKKGLAYMGTRACGKTRPLSAWMYHSYTFCKDFEGVVAASNEEYIKNFMSSMDTIDKNLPEEFKLHRLTNRTYNEIRSGMRSAVNGEILGLKSRILTRNFNRGENTSALIGLRPNRVVIENAGHLPNLLQCFTDSEPAIMDSNGKRWGIPVLISGSGSSDFNEIFYNPEAYGFLSFDNAWEGTGKIGYFVPAYLNQNAFKDDQGITYVNESLKHTLDVREGIKNSMGTEALEQHIGYYPNKPSEILMINHESVGQEESNSLLQSLYGKINEIKDFIDANNFDQITGPFILMLIQELPKVIESVMKTKSLLEPGFFPKDQEE